MVEHPGLPFISSREEWSGVEGLPGSGWGAMSPPAFGSPGEQASGGETHLFAPPLLPAEPSGSKAGALDQLGLAAASGKGEIFFRIIISEKLIKGFNITILGSITVCYSHSPPSHTNPKRLQILALRHAKPFRGKLGLPQNSSTPQKFPLEEQVTELLNFKSFI